MVREGKLENPIEVYDNSDEAGMSLANSEKHSVVV